MGTPLVQAVQAVACACEGQTGHGEQSELYSKFRLDAMSFGGMAKWQI